MDVDVDVQPRHTLATRKTMYRCGVWHLRATSNSVPSLNTPTAATGHTAGFERKRPPTSSRFHL
jgi:hypothetical protein